MLEKHYTPDGFTHVFKRKGYEWDDGIQYIGELRRETSLLTNLFDYITDSELKWADMGDIYDRIIIGDKHYDFELIIFQTNHYFKGKRAELDELVINWFNRKLKNYH